jgi:hypothetical protein
MDDALLCLAAPDDAAAAVYDTDSYALARSSSATAS